MLALYRSVTDQIQIDKGQITITVLTINPKRVLIDVAIFGKTYRDWIALRQPYHILPDVMIKLLTVCDTHSVRLGVEAPKHIDIRRPEDPERIKNADDF